MPNSHMNNPKIPAHGQVAKPTRAAPTRRGLAIRFVTRMSVWTGPSPSTRAAMA